MTNRYHIYRTINRLLSFISKKFKLTRVLHKPRALMVEPTNHCNMQCPLCPTGTDALNAPRGYMDMVKFKQLIDELGFYLEEINLWGFGEPLLHKDIFEMVNYVSKRGIRSKISTNGQPIREWVDAENIVNSGLDILVISLDGASHETLSKYRKNASFESILTGIRRINKTKKRMKIRKPKLILQFIVMKHNEYEINKIADLAKQLKMSLVLRPLSVGMQKDEWLNYLPDERKYSRYLYDSNKIIKGSAIPQPKICPFPWDWTHVNWDGSIVPCCKDPNRDHLLGNAFDEGGFMKAWNSEKFMTFRKTFIKNKNLLIRCKYCVLPLNA